MAIDKQTPDPAALARLAEVLGAPRDYFLDTPFEPGTRPRFFRSMASATKRARERIEQHLTWLQRLGHDLQTWVDLPAPNLPELDVGDFRPSGSAIPWPPSRRHRRWRGWPPSTAANRSRSAASRRSSGRTHSTHRHEMGTRWEVAHDERAPA